MLSERLTGYLTYFERLAMQPANRWEGFYLPRRDESHFGLRYQLAFACYALASICLHPQADPEEQQRCHRAMSALIDRMIQRRVWAYWSTCAELAGLNPDPVAMANGQYSSHLGMMLGAYEIVGGDQRYDEAFTFRWSPFECFTHTHSSLVQSLWQQMESNHHHGVESKAGQVRVCDMAHVLWATLLHDAIHGTTYAEANSAWLAFLRQNLVAREVPLLGRRSVFIPFYSSRRHLLAPSGMSVVDAWTLSFLALLAPDLTSLLCPRLLRSIRHRPTSDPSTPHAHLPAARRWISQEVADHTTCTGFAYILAVEVGDEALAAAMLSYADTHFKPVTQEGERWYSDGLAAVLTTALFALGEAGGLRTLKAMSESRHPLPRLIEREEENVEGWDAVVVPSHPISEG